MILADEHTPTPQTASDLRRMAKMRQTLCAYALTVPPGTPLPDDIVADLGVFDTIVELFKSYTLSVT